MKLDTFYGCAFASLVVSRSYQLLVFKEPLLEGSLWSIIKRHARLNGLRQVTNSQETKGWVVIDTLQTLDTIIDTLLLTYPN